MATDVEKFWHRSKSFSCHFFTSQLHRKRFLDFFSPTSLRKIETCKIEQHFFYTWKKSGKREGRLLKRYILIFLNTILIFLKYFRFFPFFLKPTQLVLWSIKHLRRCWRIRLIEMLSQNSLMGLENRRSSLLFSKPRAETTAVLLQLTGVV